MPKGKKRENRFPLPDQVEDKFRGNDREKSGNDPGETGFHGAGIKESENDRIRR